MRLPWTRPKADQLELLDADPEVQSDLGVAHDRPTPQPTVPARATPPALTNPRGDGQALFVAIDRLCEDPTNPRTEFPEEELVELSEDIRQHGILQPIVVHPANEQGTYRIHFGAKRWRAAQRAGLAEVPVVVRDVATDPYTQVAENQKRHGLTPLDLARFIKRRIADGDSNATIAQRLGMNLTTVAHHLSLLDLPRLLDDAMKAGRCTSPRTLHELSKLHGQRPEQVKALVDRPGEITREAVSALRELAGSGATTPSARLISQAFTACDRLDKLLRRVGLQAPDSGGGDLDALRAKVAALSSWSVPGSDGQTS